MRSFLLTALALLLVGGQVFGDQKREAAFGNLEPMSTQDAKAKAAAWLQNVSTDAATIARFEAIWNQPDRTVLDMTAETFALGDAGAAKLLAEARDGNTAARRRPCLVGLLASLPGGSGMGRGSGGSYGSRRSACGKGHHYRS